MLSELLGEIEQSGGHAGWIKLRTGDDSLSACETIILHASTSAARETNVVIGSHTIQGWVVRAQHDIIEVESRSLIPEPLNQPSYAS